VLDDHRARRIAHRGDEHGDGAGELPRLARHVEAQQGHDAREAHEQSDEALPPRTLGRVDADRDEATMSGSEAMRMAVSEEEIRCSPHAMSGNGMAISRKV
jgi:hypothetical protein